jgi:non-ribosomal peptide synthetase component F/aryl carrier-like protein
LTPTVAALIKPSDTPTLKTLVLAGEAIPLSVVDEWSSAVNLHNCYGPAEASICTWKDSVGKSGTPANVGKGLASLLWIVEPENVDRLTPIGCAGELLIEGPMLAREYLNDPEKTASSFIFNPAWARSSPMPRRFFRTGDLMQYNSDGTMDYLGRIDDQRKVHGQRVELSEIEHHITHHLPDSVHVAVELVKLDTLVAFLSFPNTAEPLGLTASISTLLETHHSQLINLANVVAGVLPSYMIPVAYIPLDVLPTNASGKTDRRQLRTIAERMSEDEFLRCCFAERQKRTPNTPAEKRMHALWMKTLGLSPDSIGADDSFFRLGADSVTAMKLVAAARQEGIHLSVANVFKNPILSQLSVVASSIVENEQLAELAPFELLPKELSIQDIIEAIADQCQVNSQLITDVYPPTPLQEGLMALSNKQQGSYVLRNITQIPENLDITRLKRAWDAVFRENPILRTRIVYLESVGTFQAVILHDSIEWLSGNNLRDYLTNDQSMSIEYGSALSRYSIIEESERKRYFVWTLHHAVYDGWSMSLILKRVEQLYHEPIGHLTTSIPYNQFVRHVLSLNGTEAEKFWMSYLHNAGKMRFPQCSPSRDRTRVDGTLTSRLDFQRSANSDITVSTVIRAAWGAVVARYSDSDDIIFGSTQSGRNADLSGIDNIVGPSITTVPIRSKINRSDTIAQHLQRIQDETTTMIPFEHVGLQNIRKLSQNAKEACSFQNLLLIQLPMEEHEGNRMTWKQFESENEAHDVESHVSNLFSQTYPLLVECTLRKSGIDISLSYDKKVLSTSQTKRVLHQFEHSLLQLNSESWDTTMSDLELFSPFDQQLLSQWNSQNLAPKVACIHDLFTATAMTQPSAQAICSWDGNLTYRELDRLSTILALHLESLGITAEAMVPSFFEKSRIAVVAQMAILKAGGALVPLDVNHPEGRRRKILADIQAKVILTTPNLSNLFDGLVEHIVSLDEELLVQLGQTIDTNTSLKRSVKPSNAAIVIYTSGSTGEPKGVVLEHTAICSGMQAHGDLFHVGPNTRVMNFAAYVFDVSIQDVFTTLARGGCICKWFLAVIYE